MIKILLSLPLLIGKEASTINNTKIKYLKLPGDKIYKVTDISFFHMEIRAVESLSSAASIPDDEVWDVEEFKKYKITLINNGGCAEIVDFNAYKSRKSG